MSEKKDLTIQELNKKHFVGGALVIVFLFLMFSQTVYDCSEVRPEILQEAYQSCLSSKNEQEKLKNELEMEEMRLDLEKDRQEKEHCLLMAKEGKDCSEEKNFIRSKKLSFSNSCEEQVKPLFCQPKNFIWKLWYL